MQTNERARYTYIQRERVAEVWRKRKGSQEEEQRDVQATTHAALHMQVSNKKQGQQKQGQQKQGQQKQQRGKQVYR